MALLHYHNLTDHRPDMLMRKTFDGLKNFYSFLTRTRNYLKSDASVKRLAWRSIERKGSKKEYGYWVQLIEPEGRLNEPESTFRGFLDENNSEIYESLSIDESSSRVIFNDALKIKVLDRDFDAEQLLLERKPLHPDLVLRPNTWPIECQLRALQQLQDAPSEAHRPLLRLFEASDHADWPDLPGYESTFYYSSEAKRFETKSWFVLTDEDRPGTSEQREFVEIAINTPDFAFLEGPPGSGKTTAICELILQLATQGKRVLLCASTHVAVDNVLERLMDESNAYQDQVIPVRIGDKSNVSEKAKKWQLENFVKTEKDRLLRALHECKARTLSQEELLNQLRAGNNEVQRIVLDCANLVCGTTIGILQPPDIKNKESSNPQFDVLIIDEASKTTFQEFLVPALLAKRWVLVGDPKQLSPFVDEDSMAVNIEPCLPDPTQRNACVDVFLASQPGIKQRRSCVVVYDPKDTDTFDKYRAQADAHKVDIANAEIADKKLPYAAITVGSIKSLTRKSDGLPLDITHIRAKQDELLHLRRRVASYRKSAGHLNEELPQWEKEVGWRLTRRYDLRLNTQGNEDESSRRSTSERLQLQLESLLPTQNTEDVRSKIDGVRRVALPSVLESLRYGFERNERQRTGSALSDGFPEEMLNERHVLLSTQHRMHADIAEFPHKSIYHGEALFTPDFLNAKRDWNYSGFKHRAVWFDVKGNANNRSNSNNLEAKKIIKQLQKFDRWAEENPRDDGGAWEAAILTFYRGQEKEIRKLLRKWSGDHKSVRYFHRGRQARPYLSIQVCTVDRFQGHEADLVMLSFTKNHPTSFLESPNRLNVAITRARYQLVVFGNRNALQKASGVLGRFASQSHWVKEL
jgi:hypothetical protein